MITTDRRQGRRISTSRPAKLRCLQTGKYIAGQTRNVSATGALLEVDRPSLLVRGQRIEVGIAWSRRNAVLRSGEDLVAATVVRSLGLGRIQHVAVQFDQAQSVSETGWVPGHESESNTPYTAVH